MIGDELVYRFNLNHKKITMTGNKIQIQCPHFMNSQIIQNGQHQMIYVCRDQNKPIDPATYCCGDLCRFVNIEKKEEEVKKEEVTTNENVDNSKS